MARTKVLGIIWDFDGTLADTGARNFKVTRNIVRQIQPDVLEKKRVLRVREEYERCHRRISNWREFYTSHLGFDEDRTDQAGRLWGDFQSRETDPVPLFDGVVEVLERLRHVPHGVVSQNSRPIIADALRYSGVERRFGMIVGYEEVPLRRQKPLPDGLLHCVAELVGNRDGVVLFVGDHDTDVETASNANTELRRSGAAIRIRSVGVEYGRVPGQWRKEPDYRIEHPNQIVPLAL